MSSAWAGLRQIALSAAILLILPLIIYVSSWQWQPSLSVTGLRQLYWLTQTATRPWGMATSLLLVSLLICLRRDRGGLALRVILFVLVAVWGGQGVNLGLKHQFHEARPYIYWLQPDVPDSADDFYRLTPEERRAKVLFTTKRWQRFPAWQRAHWANETGYSFPSGHGMFVSCWVLVFVALLRLRSQWLICLLTGLWAAGVMWSRIALGMHWPRDLMAAIVVAWLWVSLIFLIAGRFLRPPSSETGKTD